MAGLVAAVLTLPLLLRAAAADSREWPVGDSYGWGFGVMGWPNYKPFKAGDVLLFKYKAGQHNVVAVKDDAAAYSLCQFPANATIYSSGDDRVTLARGMTFFLCGFADHCTNGLKMAVTAS
ncbi:hypothetical protein ABZP36_003775 [Zizania latifolia]